jgi:hypothetical protein
MELNMTDNLNEEHEKAVSYARYIRDTFGVDGVGYEPMDAPTASPKSSAAQHVKERNEALADYHRELREAEVEVTIALRADADAYERVTTGASTSEADKRAALRHGHRYDLIPKQTSAEKLVAQSRS